MHMCITLAKNPFSYKHYTNINMVKINQRNSTHENFAQFTGSHILLKVLPFHPLTEVTPPRLTFLKKPLIQRVTCAPHSRYFRTPFSSELDIELTLELTLQFLLLKYKMVIFALLCLYLTWMNHDRKLFEEA